jgi:hypothetical protein
MPPPGELRASITATRRATTVAKLREELQSATERRVVQGNMSNELLVRQHKMSSRTSEKARCGGHVHSCAHTGTPSACPTLSCCKCHAVRCMNGRNVCVLCGSRLVHLIVWQVDAELQSAPCDHIMTKPGSWYRQLYEHRHVQAGQCQQATCHHELLQYICRRGLVVAESLSRVVH